MSIAKINGVAIASIAKVNGVAIAAIDKINGVAVSGGGVVAPTVDAGGPYTITVGAAEQMVPTVVNGSDPSPAYAWSINSGPAGGTWLPSSITLAPTFTPAAEGAYVLQLQVTPNDGPPVTDTANLTSEAAAGPPVVDAGGPYTVEDGQFIQLLAASVTPGSDPSPVILWTVESGPSGYTSDWYFTYDVNPWVTFTPAGTYVLKLTVTPNDGPAVSDTATLENTAALVPPTITIDNGPFEAFLNIPVQTAVTTTPGDGTITSYLWKATAVPQGGSLTFLPSNAVEEPTVSADVAGPYSFNVEVQDSNFKTDNAYTTFNAYEEPAYVILDNFTDTNGVLIDAHTPDIDTVGTGWSLMGTGTADIQDNKYHVLTQFLYGGYIIDSGLPNPGVVGTIQVPQPIPNTIDKQSILLRVQDYNNYIFCEIYPFSNNIYIQSREAGGIFQRAFTGLPAGSWPKTLRTSIADNIVTCRAETTSITWDAGTLFDTETDVGMGVGYLDATVDPFYVYDASNPSEYFIDTFIGVNGANITNHTPDWDASGNGWFIGTGASADIQSNECHIVYSPQYGNIYMTTPSTEQKVTVTLAYAASGQGGVVARRLDNDNYWRAYRFGTYLLIDSMEAGTMTNRALEDGYPAGFAGEQLIMTASGNDISAVITGSFNPTGITVNNSFGNTYSAAGLVAESAGTKYDDFIVEAP